MKKDKEFHTVRGYQMLNNSQSKLTSSMEDHLEMIYRICMEDGYVRINQLANKLNIQPSSTTKIVSKLGELGFVNYQKYGIVQLTDKGAETGHFLLTRHKIIEQFLKNIGIDKTLLKDTEMIEHFMSHNTLSNLHSLNKFFSSNPEILVRYNEFKEQFHNDAI